jgi:drug/metabolite transporter (DMT)-like permease
MLRVGGFFWHAMTKQTKAELALLATTFIWGSTFAFVKMSLVDISPILMGAVRFTVAALFFLLISWKNIFPLPDGALARSSLLGFLLFAGFISQNIGLVYTTASKSAFITSLMVVFVPFFQYFVERRPPTWGNVLGIGIVLIGLWFLTSPSGAEFNVGDGLTLFTAVVFALYIVYLDIASKAMSPVQLTFLQSAATGMLSWFAALGFERMVFNPTTSMITSLAYLTLFATIITTFVQTTFQKDTTPTRAVIIFTVEPVWAAIIAYVVLGEHLGALGILGGALIILGVLVSELSVNILGLNRAVTK